MKWPVKKWIKLISGFDFIWIVTQRTCSSGPFLPYLLVPLSFFFRVDYFQRDVFRAESRTNDRSCDVMCTNDRSSRPLIF